MPPVVGDLLESDGIAVGQGGDRPFAVIDPLADAGETAPDHDQPVGVVIGLGDMRLGLDPLLVRFAD